MPTYTVTFKKDSPVWDLYQKLKENGVKDSDLDQGYPKTDYANKKRTTIGKNDRKIQKEEVLDYALERHERYRLAIKGSMGDVIPWGLDDLDPKTDFDHDLRGKISAAITYFEEKITQAGHKKDKDRFKELLAVSLYTFAMASKKNKSMIRFPKNVMDELTKAGLKDIISYIGKEGGLGLIDFKSDCELEATALEALKNNCGECTEMSKILYALFNMAGLKAKFIYGLPKPEFYKKFQKDIGKLHVSLALKSNEKIRIFDCALELSDAKSFYDKYFKYWLEQTNREALASHHFGLAVSYQEEGDLSTAIAEYQKAREINPFFLEAHYNLGFTYYKKNELKLAIAEFNAVIKIHPNFVNALFMLGTIYFNWGEFDLALPKLEKAVKIDPNHAEAHLVLGYAYAQLGSMLESNGENHKARIMYSGALRELKLANKLGKRSAQKYFNSLKERINRLTK